MPQSEQVQAILARGAITAQDVRDLRHRVFWKGVVTEDDAEVVFLLNDRFAHTADPTWSAFFVEALTDYLVVQAQPRGYISDENAVWLIARIARSGRIDTQNELELLVRILERAQRSPVDLIRFALEQVKRGVILGEGCIGRCHIGALGIVEAHETELVRRMLYAFGGDANIAVTQPEAEVLFDINDATCQVSNHPSWSDLYVKALANFMMAASGYQVPCRQEALRREAWLDSPTEGIPGFMSRMLSGGLNSIWQAYTPTAPVERSREPRITAQEAHWAASRIGRDGRLHENEMALINFLKSHNTHLHPQLLPVLDRIAA